jgi:polysaccharide export outer membrane protein
MHNNHSFRIGIAVIICLAACNCIAQDIASKELAAREVATKDVAMKDAATPVSVAVSAPDAGVSVAATMVPQSGTSQFILGPADVIHVNVWKNVELSQTVTVGPDGFVSLPLLGDVHVAGMTANELGQKLAIKLNSYVVNPQVTVSVVDIRSRQVFVLGQVAKPGGYSLISPVNVLQLIALAGGLSNFANRKEIIVLRLRQGGTQKIIFNYNSAIHGDGKQNIDLQPGDTVVVP